MIKKPEFTRTDVEIIRREEMYKRFFRVEKIFLRHKLPYILRDFHRAEFRAAHRAEVCNFCRFLGQGFIVIRACGIRIQTQVKLVFPTEFKAGFG